jgi:hypothetical protein
MSTPPSWSQVLDFFGTPLPIEPGVAQRWFGLELELSDIGPSSAGKIN